MIATVLFVAFLGLMFVGVPIGAALGLAGTAAIALDDRRLDAVEPKLLECVPSACLVCRTCNSLTPKFRAENHRTARRLSNETRVTVLVDINKCGVTDQGARL